MMRSKASSWIRSGACIALFCCALSPIDGQEVAATINIGQAIGTQTCVAVDPNLNLVLCGTYGGVVPINGGDDSFANSPGSGWGETTFETAAAVNPATGRVYLVEYYSPNSYSSLRVHTESDGVNRADIDLGSAPYGVAVNSSTNTVYVATASGIVVVDGATSLKGVTIPVLGATGIAVDSTRNRLYAVYSVSGVSTLAVIDGSSNVINTVGLRPSAYGIAVNPVTNSIYVTLSNGNAVQVLEGSGFTEIAKLTVGAEPQAIAVNTVTNVVYVCNLADGSVTTINGATNVVRSTLNVPSPWAIAVNEATNLTYVAGGNTGLFSVIYGEPVQPVTVSFSNMDQIYAAASLQGTITTNPAGIAYSVSYSKNGMNFGNAASDIGTYAVAVTITDPRYAGSGTGTFTIEPQPLPVISAQPSSLSVPLGGTATFGVTASGSGPLYYVWNFNGVPIGSNDSFGSSYTVSNAQASNAGSYTVEVTNQTQGSVLSSAANLAVNLPAVAPTITTPPSNVTVTAGSSATLVVAAAGTTPVSFQWSLNGSPISGANAATLTIAATTSANAGSYSVTATNAAGSTSSTPAKLTVEAYAAGAPAIATNPAAQTVASGQTVVFNCVGSPSVGTSGDPLQARAALPETYQWYFNGVAVADGSVGSTTVSGSMSPTLVIANPANAGIYTCTVTDSAGVAMSLPATLRLSQSPSDPGRLTNLSFRAYAGTGSNVLIAGFVVDGTSQALPVLVRASGPAIAAAPFNVPGVLADPKLQLHATVNGADSVLATDAGWNGSAAIAAAAAQVGAFSWGTSATPDSALLETLAIGPYTSVISGTGGGPTDNGVVLVEVYDATPAGNFVAGQSSRLVNISARAEVGTGANVTIAGFVVGGQTSATVLIRASGPAIAKAPFSVPGTLADPKLELHQTVNGADQVVASNTGWGGSSQLASIASTVGAFSWGTSGTADSAILVTLAPGSYTAIVSGAAGSSSDSGVALLEVYQVP